MDMELFGQLETYELIILAVAGVLLILCGYRIKKVAFFLAWFVLGYNLMVLFMPTLKDLVPQIAENNLWQTLIPIGGGLLLALLGFSIEKLCVGGLCFALTMVVTVKYFGTEMQTLAIGGVVGLILGGAAVALMKPATIVATSGVGAYALTMAILYLWPGVDFGAFYWPLVGGITALGTVIQFMTTRKSS